MDDMLPLIFLIADYGVGDLAFSEVKKQIRGRVGDADIEYVNIRPYSTLSNGFCTCQLALNENTGSRYKTYIFSNTAPRRDIIGPRKNNEGEGLVYAKLKNGVEILAVFSGYTLSFVKPLIERFNAVNVQNYGSQFRSRDKYPAVLAQIIKGDYSSIGKKLDIMEIPDVPKGRIAYIDGYGNVKITLQVSQLKDVKPGDTVEIAVGRRKLYGTYTDGIFGVREGELCVAPGSSGPEDDRFLEISVRLGNAWKELHEPDVEGKVVMNKVLGRNTLRLYQKSKV